MIIIGILLLILVVVVVDSSSFCYNIFDAADKPIEVDILPLKRYKNTCFTQLCESSTTCYHTQNKIPKSSPKNIQFSEMENINLTLFAGIFF